jgi:5'(3')-deoxyribonucleotidase
MRTIAIDCDSVLFPINEVAVLPYMSAALGREVSRNEITDWTYGAIEDGFKHAKVIFTRPNLYDGYDLSITEGAVDGLAALRATYDRVIAVSAPFWQHASSKWAYLLRCGFHHDDIFLCADKASVRFDVLVDDAPHTCVEIGANRVVVFDQPWNRDLDLTYPRAYGWEDVPRKVARLF